MEKPCGLIIRFPQLPAMRIRFLFFLLLVLVIAVSWYSQTPAWKKTKARYHSHPPARYEARAITKERLTAKAQAARRFTTASGMNTTLCFFVDMRLPSGQQRFFIYDLQQDSVISSALVAHGNCFEYWLEGRRYSNQVGSGCTSLGKYRIGASYTGKWGYSYKLHGLDTSNSNAFERTVVLHGHRCVPENETSEEICQSNGCPTVSPLFLLQLKGIINRSRKPLLLWIYD